jgi:hypothetical protein
MVLPQRRKGTKENCYWVNGFTAKAQRPRGNSYWANDFTAKAQRHKEKKVGPNNKSTQSKT